MGNRKRTSADKQQRRAEKLKRRGDERRAAGEFLSRKELLREFKRNSRGAVLECSSCPAILGTDATPVLRSSPGIKVRDFGMVLKCPSCGGEMRPIDEPKRVVGPDGQVSMFWSFSGRDAPQVAELITRLKQLDERHVTVEALAREVEKAGPELRPVARWLRENQDLLNGVQAAGALLALVIAILAWMLPGSTSDDHAPPEPPPGITRQQMQELLDDLAAREPERDATHTDRRDR